MRASSSSCRPLTRSAHGDAEGMARQPRGGGAVEHSRERRVRIRRCQAANPVAGEPLSVHPAGHPWSISPKRGFKFRASTEESSPGLEVPRSRREIRYDHSAAAIGRVTCAEIFPVGRHTSLPFARSVCTRPCPANTVGVGQYEEALPLVSSTHLARRKDARCKPVAQASKVPGDQGKAESEVRCDVLEEELCGPRLVGDACDVRPEVAFVPEALPLAVRREGLAGIAGTEDTNSAAVAAAVEGAEIVEDRRAVKASIPHPRFEDGNGRWRALDVGDRPVVLQREPEAELEAAGAGAERQPTDGRRHLTTPSVQDGGFSLTNASAVSFDARRRS